MSTSSAAASQLRTQPSRRQDAYYTALEARKDATKAKAEAYALTVCLQGEQNSERHDDNTDLVGSVQTPTSPPPRRTTPSAFVDAALELPAPSVDAYSRRQGRPFVYVLREGNSEEGAATYVCAATQPVVELTMVYRVSKTGGCEQCEGCLLSGSILDAQHQYEALSNSATVKGFIWRYDSQCDKAEVIGRLRWAGQNKLVVIVCTAAQSFSYN